ncbi:hypothetical protein ES707_19999 [subsurface metagenome]
MNRQKRRKPKVKKSITKGLWVPQEILSIPADQLGWLGKLVCGRIYSYGAKGCYESNATLGRYFGVSLRRIAFAMEQIRSLPLTYSIKLRGRPTCYWLRCSPKVRRAERLEYRGRSKKNPAYTCAGNGAGGAPKTAQEGAPKTAHDNISTSKTTGATSPSPADRQAQRREKEEADALSKIQSHIRAEIVQHLPPVPAADLEAKKHQLSVIAEFKGKVEKLVRDGMSVDDAVKKVLGKQFVKVREESL